MSKNENVFWVVELKINDIAAFKTIAREMSDSTKNEKGTLNYEWMLNQDESRCYIYERYADSAAAVVHLGNFAAKFQSRFLIICQPTRFEFYGNPSDELRAILDGFGAVYMTPFEGFAR